MHRARVVVCNAKCLVLVFPGCCIEWRRSRGVSENDTMYAPAKLRDQFLNALDEDDSAVRNQLASALTRCINPLPGMTCEQLGLPAGSTYGSAAKHVLELSRRSADLPPATEP